VKHSVGPYYYRILPLIPPLLGKKSSRINRSEKTWKTKRSGIADYKSVASRYFLSKPNNFL